METMERLKASRSAKGNQSPSECRHAGNRTQCDACAVRHIGICSDLGTEELCGLNRIGRSRRVGSGQRIVSEQDESSHLAIVVSGIVKLTKVLPDGRQQIVGLLFPSDFLGRPFEANSRYHAEAATDVKLCSFPARGLEDLMQQLPALENRLFRHTLDELDAAQDWMLLLGRKTAREKVASLLLMITKRTAKSTQPAPQGERGTAFDLPLSRADTGDFLGLRLETVSRQMRQLCKDKIIALEGTRRVRVLNLARLELAAAGNESEAARS
jgi:CRP/FNR family transcriptional regulator